MITLHIVQPDGVFRPLHVNDWSWNGVHSRDGVRDDEHVPWDGGKLGGDLDYKHKTSGSRWSEVVYTILSPYTRVFSTRLLYRDSVGQPWE